ncbi:MAG: glycosyltransferase family 4 protein [Myxococcota bacterium]
MNLTVLTLGLGRGQGASGYAEGLVRGLRARGHVVHVPELKGRRSLVRSRRADGVLVSLERAPHADVWRAGGGVHAVAMAALGKRRPSLDAWLEQRAARTARVVVANSTFVADQLMGRLGVPSARIEVVRTGVDLARFQVASERSGAVLFAAHGWTRKGFEVAVRAFAFGAPRTSELWVAGRDARRASRLRWARRMLGGRVVDLGEGVDLAPVLGRVGAVLHPTRYDAAANLVLEGLASGVPVVTSVMDGSAEIVPDPGLVALDPMDADGVAACLRRALDSADPAPWRAAAERWPESRNHSQMEVVATRCVNG